MKKVSIIIPVYNAEKYLGYCINSVLKQTYQNLELILVNDGSEDNSLKICRNYAAIDERVNVIDIPNGGVGHARNIGLENAGGDYVQFVDSDDVIAAEMTEKLVEAAETYQMNLIVCGMEIITLDKEKPNKRISCSSEMYGKECVLSNETFIKKLSSILWETVTLEGPCNKLYVRDVLEKNSIRFSETVSLGEDFLMNMRYFKECNGVVLLSEKYYYYLQTNENSLSQKYRQDMFSNQIMLMEEFCKLLPKDIDERERRCLSNYLASKAVQCIGNLFSEGSKLKSNQIKAEISVIINHPLVRKSLDYCDCISEKNRWIIDCKEYSDVGTIYYHMLSNMDNKLESNVQMKSESKTPNPGHLNCFLVAVINKSLHCFQCKYLEMVRNSLEKDGIKITIDKCLKYRKNNVSRG